MKDRFFFDLCYDLYKREMDDAEAIYRRAGVLLIALPILGGVTIKMGRTDILVDCFARVDTFFYYLATSVSLLSVFISAVFLILTACPRKYQNLASMGVWQEWRDEYQEYLGNNGEKDIPEKSLPIKADPAQMQQVFLNLLNNAFDAVHDLHGANGGKINVTIVETDNRNIMISVEDNGGCISPENKENI